MHRSTLRLVLALTVALLVLPPTSLLSPSARAGGWAAVRLDAQPTNVAVEVPVEIGFTVLQHDTHPVTVEEEFGPEAEVTLEAQHRDTAQMYRATASHQGAEGHYVVEATFPRAGQWTWSIIPAPFAGTSFAPLTVLDAPTATSPGAAAGRTAQIVAGTCADRGATTNALADPAADRTMALSDASIDDASGTVGSTDAAPVHISETTLDLALADLLATPHAITVGADLASTLCGDLGGRMWDGELVVGLAGSDVASGSGIATLREENGRTRVTIYLVATPDPAPDAGQSAAAAPTDTSTDATGRDPDIVAVQIVDMAFSPTTLTVPAGSTVVWTNLDAVAHTVTGPDLTSSGSDILAPGATFTQTFTEPGTYTYHCFPHPSMTATITVTP